MADGAAVAARAVQPAAHVRLGRRRGQRPAEDSEAVQRPGGASERRGARPAGESALADGGQSLRQGVDEVAVDLEVAGDVGLGETELPGVAEQPPERVG
jgi:hypothetical protein